MSTESTCPRSERVDGPWHSWRFDGDDPYVVCVYCGERQDSMTGRVVTPTPDTERSGAVTNEEEWSCGKPGCDLGIDGHDFALAIQHIYGTTPEVAASVVDGVARRLGVGEAASTPTPSPPQADLCECGHEWGVHLIDTSLRHVCVPDCLCTAYRPATPPTPGPDTERSPDGLVERVVLAWEAGPPVDPEQDARVAALAVADWLDRRYVRGSTAAWLIRREVEGAGS